MSAANASLAESGADVRGMFNRIARRYDATRKWKDEGFTREWPEVLKMTPAVVARVDALWKELGL